METIEKAQIPYILAREEDRLDKIFFRYHSQIDLFPTFLELNHKLLRYAWLEAGQKVFLLEEQEQIQNTIQVERSPLLLDED